MCTVTFILGLAGSGKSHKVCELKRATGAEYVEGIADSSNPQRLAEMINHLREGRDCVVEEIALCRVEYRTPLMSILKSQVPAANVQWICFERDLESANWNVMNRPIKTDKVAEHLGINAQYFPLYTFPEDAVVVPIRRVPPRTVV